MAKYIQVEEGKDVCPKCKIGILEYRTSEEAKNNVYACDRCSAKFKYD